MAVSECRGTVNVLQDCEGIGAWMAVSKGSSEVVEFPFLLARDLRFISVGFSSPGPFVT
jgi:hypothetical protein